MLYLYAFLLTTTLMFASSEKTTLPIGSAAPSVSTLDHNGDPIDLGAALSEKLSLVFFYPKAHTPGCTQQACSLRDAFSLLQEKGVQVFGVSSDSPKAQKSFRDKHALPYTLISDKKSLVAHAFGKSRWSRHAYLFNRGVLIWKNTKGATASQGEEAIAALKSLGLY